MFFWKRTNVCSACKGELGDVYVEALGGLWHRECFCCAACGLGIEAQFVEHNGLPYHESCYHEHFSKRCCVCNEILTGSHLSNWWGDLFCSAHEYDCESCFSCGRPISERSTRGGARYGDGRTVCSICLESAVNNQVDVDSAINGLLREFRDLGMPFEQAVLPVSLVEKHDLDPNSSGHTEKRVVLRNGVEVERILIGIRILHGLPRVYFDMVAAHELGHAWLFFNEVDNLDPEEEEGFCQLCGFLILKRRNEKLARFWQSQIEENRDPIYGYGFRMAHGSYERHGLASVIAALRKGGKLPR